MSIIVSVDIENKSVVYLRGGCAESGRFSVCRLSRSNNPLHLYARLSRHLLLVFIQHFIMSNPSTAKIRRIVLTGSIAAITATGAWYGAGLKVQQERNEVGKIMFFKSSVTY